MFTGRVNKNCCCELCNWKYKHVCFPGISDVLSLNKSIKLDLMTNFIMNNASQTPHRVYNSQYQTPCRDIGELAALKQQYQKNDYT